MSRLRQTNEQKAGKQNTSQTEAAYYGGSDSTNSRTKKKVRKKKRSNMQSGY